MSCSNMCCSCIYIGIITVISAVYVYLQSYNGTDEELIFFHWTLHFITHFLLDLYVNSIEAI